MFNHGHEGSAGALKTKTEGGTFAEVPLALIFFDKEINRRHLHGSIYYTGAVVSLPL